MKSNRQIGFSTTFQEITSYESDWHVITLRKQRKIKENNARENRKRLDYKYKPGELVTQETARKILKLARPRTGPFEVIADHNNGTVTIQKAPYVTERVNKRLLRPCHTR